MNRKVVEDGWIIWEPNFIGGSESDEYFDYFLNELPWSGGMIKIFGKEFEIPRKQVFMSDDNLTYAYSGKSLTQSPWDDRVLTLKDKIEKSCKHEFNACLANLYRDGQDSNGWHSDNEKELGVDPVIASLSFGATRKFDLRHNTTKEKLTFDLSHGSLIIMGGALQHHWKHQVPKTKRVDEARVNLTFRKLLKQKV
tara:strand:- start:41328 stop:41915 length:588 start_codon:yes stop_codon:yes gene_type:complete